MDTCHFLAHMACHVKGTPIVCVCKMCVCVCMGVNSLSFTFMCVCVCGCECVCVCVLCKSNAKMENADSSGTSVIIG
jgi:hypothetical protein